MIPLSVKITAGLGAVILLVTAGFHMTALQDLGAGLLLLLSGMMLRKPLKNT